MGLTGWAPGGDTFCQKKCRRQSKTSMREPLTLVWKKARSGYCIEPRASIGPGRKHRGLILYGSTFIELLDGSPGETFVVPKTGAKALRDEPRVDGVDALRDLASADATPEAALEYAQKWGLLDDHNELPLSDFCRASAEAWAYMTLMAAGRWRELAALVHGRSINAGRRRFAGGRRPVREANTLRDLCFLNLMDLIANEERVARCLLCRKFLVGRQQSCDCCRKWISKRNDLRAPHWGRKNISINQMLIPAERDQMTRSMSDAEPRLVLAGASPFRRTFSAILQPLEFEPRPALVFQREQNTEKLPETLAEILRKTNDIRIQADIIHGAMAQSW